MTEAAVLRSTQGTPVPLQGVAARGQLSGLLFELTVEQTYRNTGTANIEAVYTFPVPHSATLLGLDLRIGERQLSGVAVRRQAATEQYEEALDQGNSAALLEQAGDGLYTLSLGNLLAGETAVIRYRYAELLDRHEDYLRLSVPTVIAPRYGAAAAHGLAPHQVPGVALLAAYPFSLEIQVLGELARAVFSSPSHTIQVSALEGGMRVALANGAELDRDFILQLTGAVTESASLTATDGDGFVSLVSLDTRLGTAATRPVGLKLVVDCSGSMAGDSIAQARRALLAVLDRLTPADAVSLTRFGSTVETLVEPQGGDRGGWLGSLRNRLGQQPGPRRVVLARLQMAARPTVEWLKHAVRDLQADLGGTEMAVALQAAIALPASADTPAGCSQDLLLITDGEIWAVEQVVELAARSGHRLFVVAVGAAPAEALARYLSARTGGAVEFVSPNEDIEGAIVRMFGRMRETPKHIEAVEWPVTPEWTGPLPAAVFSGDTLHLTAGFRSAPAGDVRVTITGVPEGKRILRCPVAAVSNLELLPRVAAARRLAELGDEEAAALAERHQLVSRHTSFVVVQERAAAEKPMGLPVLAAVPHLFAAGWGGMGEVAFSLPGSAMGITYGRDGAEPMMASPSQAAPPPMYCADDVPSFLRGWSGERQADLETFGLEDNAQIPPRQVLEVLLHAAAQGALSFDLLDDLGVPAPIVDELRRMAAAGPGAETLIHLFAALLARSPAGAGLTPEQRATLAGDVLSRRELRDARVAVQRLLRDVTEESWSGVVTV